MRYITQQISMRNMKRQMYILLMYAYGGLDAIKGYVAILMPNEIAAYFTPPTVCTILSLYTSFEHVETSYTMSSFHRHITRQHLLMYDLCNSLCGCHFYQFADGQVQLPVPSDPHFRFCTHSTDGHASLPVLQLTSRTDMPQRSVAASHPMPPI